MNVTVDAYPGVVFEGKINAINAQVDDATRNVLVQATVANADERVKPGMFAVVEVVLPFEPTLTNEYSFVTSALSEPSRLTKAFLEITKAHFNTAGSPAAKAAPGA